MPQTKWGVIYCPKTASRRAQCRWRRILRQLRSEGIAFDHAVSDSRGAVERLAAMMTQAGYPSIVVVGGDSALNEALNGVLAAGAEAGVKMPALGIIPNGYGNDFARYWGLEEGKYKEAIKNLILHRQRKVDVGRADITFADGTVETRHFLNCVNVGLAASLIQTRKKTRTFWGLNTLSYLTSALLLLVKRRRFKMRFTVNSEDVCHDEMTVCVGSATGYGQTPSAVPYNGQLDVTAVSHPHLLGLFNGLWLLFTGRFLTHESVKVWRTRHIAFTEIGRATVSLDGKIVHGRVARVDVTIRPEAISFLIPS
ncbi:MAG: lipid kinase [Bacteroidaceae bacterium]|nr:lipid kinase [Bacteroidaceae bacterium]